MEIRKPKKTIKLKSKRLWPVAPKQKEDNISCVTNKNFYEKCFNYKQNNQKEWDQQMFKIYMNSRANSSSKGGLGMNTRVTSATMYADSSQRVYSINKSSSEKFNNLSK